MFYIFILSLFEFARGKRLCLLSNHHFFKHPTLGFLNTLSATTPPRPTADDGRKTPAARSRPTPVRQKAWWWQTAWESGSGAGGRQHGRMGRGKWESRVLGLGLDVGLG
ncbi:uncharacterized protein [Gossypium hirsutum]|uniref:Uncharacterized protein isoform X3 n=1 Tax=Gossypium hirsutum TaxID=3635 RepID=A0ABM2Z854_GOSHI|nr:uncharacterized protein LOC121210812 isoform X3 [Gossypium hirsutum]